MPPKWLTCTLGLFLLSGAILGVVLYAIHGEPPRAEPDPALWPLVASVNRPVYHRRGCPLAARIKPDNRTWFRSAAVAEATGRRPCKRCGHRRISHRVSSAPSAP